MGKIYSLVTEISVLGSLVENGHPKAQQMQFPASICGVSRISAAKSQNQLQSEITLLFNFSLKSV